MPRRGPARAPLVTLTSDVGAAYAAQMKAVLARAIDPGRIVDLAHDLPAHRIPEGAFVLRAMARGFPAGSIHVAVVDPGVGGRRAALAVRCRDGSTLVGPDNGLLLPLAAALGGGTAYRLEPERWAARDRVGTTFDGRDLFAPAAARLATGTRASELGSVTQPLPLALPVAVRTAEGARGEVLHRDTFGNLITNIPTGWVGAGTRHVTLRGWGRARSVPWVASYDAVRAGATLALGSSFGTVELAVRVGSAARSLRHGVGATVELAWRRRRNSMGK